MMLREIGLVLFLASVGIKAGAGFFETVVDGDGLLYVLTGFLITIIPILVVGPIARLKFKFNYFTIAGMVAGTYTDPPALAYANSKRHLLWATLRSIRCRCSLGSSRHRLSYCSSADKLIN